MGSIAASGLLSQELGGSHHLGREMVPSEWDSNSTQTYLRATVRPTRIT
jgi:hypothetical protein